MAPEKQGTIVDLLARRYIQRRDLKAKQLATGAYNPVRSPFTRRDLRLHLDGRVTLGHYVVDQAGHCRVLAFDLDFGKDFDWRGQSLNPREVFGTDHPARRVLTTQIRQIADGLAYRLKGTYPQLTVTTSFSGSKGIHVLGSFPEPTTANAAREMALEVLNYFGCFELTKGKSFYRHTYLSPAVELEVFPKQETVGVGGFGNLLRLPLGIHQRTGRRSFFYDPTSAVDTFVPITPQRALEHGTVTLK
jgi:hypothetical protein